MEYVYNNCIAILSNVFFDLLCIYKFLIESSIFNSGNLKPNFLINYYYPILV